MDTRPRRTLSPWRAVERVQYRSTFQANQVLDGRNCDLSGHRGVPDSMSSWWRWTGRSLLAGLFLLAVGWVRGDTVDSLPRYDLSIDLDTDHLHLAHVRQLVTWTNCAHHPAKELVFNAHSHYQIPAADVGLLAKTLEILRMSPTDSMDTEAAPALQIQRVSMGARQLL